MRQRKKLELAPVETWYVLTWFTMFSTVPSLLLPIWKPLTDWAINASAVKIPDLHFGNVVYLEVSQQIYPLVYSYVGNHLWTWLVCAPILIADLLATLVFGSALFHLLFKFIFGGNGRYRDALTAFAFGNLPSLLFGFVPYSAAIGLAWTSLLQIPVGFHYMYDVSWNRVFIPYLLWTFFIFVAWGTVGTVSPPGLMSLIPKGPYSP
ncbi:MAG: hypothetical protein M1503_03740 [Thaumarchaeota archaeon]|nr:hypothetical protein [Nitrososphaerota archaeon]